MAYLEAAVLFLSDTPNEIDPEKSIWLRKNKHSGFPYGFYAAREALKGKAKQFLDELRVVDKNPFQYVELDAWAEVFGGKLLHGLRKQSAKLGHLLSDPSLAGGISWATAQAEADYDAPDDEPRRSIKPRTDMPPNRNHSEARVDRHLARLVDLQQAHCGRTFGSVQAPAVVSAPSCPECKNELRSENGAYRCVNPTCRLRHGLLRQVAARKPASVIVPYLFQPKELEYTSTPGTVLPFWQDLADRLEAHHIIKHAKKRILRTLLAEAETAGANEFELPVLRALDQELNRRRPSSVGRHAGRLTGHRFAVHPEVTVRLARRARIRASYRKAVFQRTGIRMWRFKKWPSTLHDLISVRARVRLAKGDIDGKLQSLRRKCWRRLAHTIVEAAAARLKALHSRSIRHWEWDAVIELLRNEAAGLVLRMGRAAGRKYLDGLTGKRPDDTDWQDILCMLSGAFMLRTQQPDKDAEESEPDKADDGSFTYEALKAARVAYLHAWRDYGLDAAPILKVSIPQKAAALTAPGRIVDPGKLRITAKRGVSRNPLFRDRRPEEARRILTEREREQKQVRERKEMDEQRFESDDTRPSRIEIIAD